MATCLCVFYVPNIGAIGTAGREIIDQFVFNQCNHVPTSVPVTRGRASLIINSAELSLWEVWRHASGPCSFQLSEKLGGLSSKCAVTHMQRELNRRADHKGKRRLSDWTKKTSTSLQSHYAAVSAILSSCCFHLLFWRRRTFRALKSWARIHVIVCTIGFPNLRDFSIQCCFLLKPLYPVNFSFFFLRCSWT